MACALTQGYTIPCRDNIGGLLSFYVIEYDNVTLDTEASGVVTAITKDTGKRFWKYELEQNTASAKETINVSRENGTVFYNQEVTIVLNKMQASIRNEVLLLAKNRCVIVGVDRNGTAFWYGKQNGMVLTGGEGGTGTASGDRNGYTLTFTSQEPELAPTVHSTVVSALETAG